MLFQGDTKQHEIESVDNWFEIPETATYCDIVLLVYRPGIEDGKTWILQSVKRLYISKNI